MVTQIRILSIPPRNRLLSLNKTKNEIKNQSVAFDPWQRAELGEAPRNHFSGTRTEPRNEFTFFLLLFCFQSNERSSGRDNANISNLGERRNFYVFDLASSFTITNSYNSSGKCACLYRNVWIR